MLKKRGAMGLTMLMYSSLLAAVLVMGAPYWLLRMLTSGRYRAGLTGRLGRVPAGLRATVAGKQVVWVHAVSVGEVLAATRLVRELETALGSGWVVVISTTTATGQALARERFGAERVFFYPLDLGWAVRAYLQLLKPKLLVLMESELWPRMLVECRRMGVPVAVANARMSDRSFRRAMQVRLMWDRVLRHVTLFLTQSEEDQRRLVAVGARAEGVLVCGNMKYDVRAPRESRVAPRHPERFEYAKSLAAESGVTSATELMVSKAVPAARQTILLDTIGDLAAVYELADVAFVGGSLMGRGGHNPLEPAQFGVPVVMGESYENFRGIVEGMRAADAIRIVNGDGLGAELLALLADPAGAKELGERGRQVFLAQAGATERVVRELMGILR